ncbi:MAG: hypothetical protein Q4E21_05870 [Clostridia bacterium]|nr:hypothetical protein [Clostridia bacterium]
MKRKRFESHSENTPDWYWRAGLHDACITSVETYEFPFDYNKYIKEKNKNNRNLLEMKIDSSGALGDCTVTDIRLFNYKILSNNIALHGRDKIWWLSDRLTANKDHFVLEIDLQDFDSHPEDFTFIIQFERAEVDRK